MNIFWGRFFQSFYDPKAYSDAANQKSFNSLVQCAELALLLALTLWLTTISVWKQEVFPFMESTADHLPVLHYSSQGFNTDLPQRFTFMANPADKSSTVIIDTRTDMPPPDLAGAQIYISHKALYTRNAPPQSATALIGTHSGSAGPAQYHQMIKIISWIAGLIAIPVTYFLALAFIMMLWMLTALASVLSGNMLANPLNWDAHLRMSSLALSAPVFFLSLCVLAKINLSMAVLPLCIIWVTYGNFCAARAKD